LEFGHDSDCNKIVIMFLCILLCGNVQAKSRPAARALSHIDVSASLGEVARDQGYTRPVVSAGIEFRIKVSQQGRAGRMLSWSG
jgi:hypothetical protein